MRIGIDLSVLQTPHRMRGIGATTINFINNMSVDIKNAHEYIFYLLPDGQDEALKLIDLNGLKYEIRTITPSLGLVLPGQLKKISSLLNSVQDLVYGYYGSNRVMDMSGVDTYLQFDQMQHVPRVRRIKKTVILYDLIPYVMESNYLKGYRTSRIKGHSRKGSLRNAYLRWHYITKVKLVCRNADKLIAISEHTKKDFIKFAHVNPDKIHVTYLGLNDTTISAKTNEKTQLQQYTKNSWGYFPSPINLTSKPFLLFVGGADPRRKLIDLVAAYNHLRAEGYDINLVLAGDTMKGPEAIPIPLVQAYLKQSSYSSGIIFLGFVTDNQREWLYEHATALVYPSTYEGFGLPVIEAMRYGTPVITYGNTSIREIGGDSVLYAEDATSIKHCAEDLLKNPKLRDTYRRLGKKQSSQFSWSTTADNVINVVVR
jgi:glycosyltransferase involved in cell wall biosynthesis